MIYYFIGAALVIAAAWVSSGLIYRKSIIDSQNKRIAQLRGDIRHYENSLQTMNDARQYYKEEALKYKEKYRDSYAEVLELRAAVKTPSPEQL